MPFFQGFDWDGVQNLRVKAPYTPDITSAEDISSFETTFTREAAVDSVSEKAPTNKDGTTKKPGFMQKMFGIGKTKQNNQTENVIDDDAFKDFAFAKEDIESNKETTTNNNNDNNPI